MKTFQIGIENPKQAYSAGDTIKGQVVFHTDQDEPVGLVNIVLEGRGKTKLVRHNGNNRRVFRGRSVFLRKEITLFQSNYTLRANRYSWPFEFTFPATTTPHPSGDTFHDNQVPRIWRMAQEVYPLPPSFSCYDGGWSQGKVEYRLEASLRKPNEGIFSTHLDYEVILNFVTRRPQPDPDLRPFFAEEPFQVRTLKLLPEKTDLTFKEKVRTIFKPDQLPQAKLVVRLAYPTQTWAKQKIPLHLSVVALDLTDDVCPVPTLHLESIHVEVKNYLNFRAPSMTIGREGELSQRYPVVNFLTRGFVIPLAEIPARTQQNARRQPGTFESGLPCLDLNKSIQGLVMPLVKPTLRTRNVSVTYKLKVKMKLSCAGKEFAFEVSEPLNVLSDLPAVTSALATNGAPSDVDTNGEQSTALPVYTSEAAPGTLIETGGPSNPPTYDQPPEYEGKGKGKEVDDTEVKEKLDEPAKGNGAMDQEDKEELDESGTGNQTVNQDVKEELGESVKGQDGVDQEVTKDLDKPGKAT